MANDVSVGLKRFPQNRMSFCGRAIDRGTHVSLTTEIVSYFTGAR